jgi:glycosyltransferase involved in cell wall biosynthesis
MSGSESTAQDAGTRCRLSVVICSHNPRPEYLTRVFAALRAQTLDKEEWELLLVDNASRERLSDVWDLSWHPHHAHVREDVLGLTPARVRGITHATRGLLVFVDDDNVLAPDYLERAAAIAEQNPHVGVFGAGALCPEFEVPPSPRLEPWLSLLALRSVAKPLCSKDLGAFRCVPWGAGLCVNRSLAVAYVEYIGRLGRLGITGVVDRRGEHLFCGGDDLFSFAAVEAGYAFGVYPELRVTHLISRGRVEPAYILRLVHDHAYSHGILRYLLFGETPPSMRLTTVAHNLLHGLRRGWFSMRCRWMSTLAAHRAARFIRATGLRPLDDVALGAPIGATTLLSTTRVSG